MASSGSMHFDGRALGPVKNWRLILSRLAYCWRRGDPHLVALTPLPLTALYKRLLVSGRLTRSKHWQEFIPFEVARTPLKIIIPEAHAEEKLASTQTRLEGEC